MKYLSSLCMACVLIMSARAQNTGIGTTTPQATLDVKGNQRIGGVNKFMTYDSVSGKIEWRNSNLYMPSSQYLFQHSAAQDGLYYNNNAPISGQLEYRNASGNPVFYTNFMNGNGYFAANLGIGTTTPLTKLHVFNGASGNPTPQGPFVVEGNSNTYFNILSPNANETAVLFGNASNAASGGIVYNNASTPYGFQFRNNGNLTRMVIDNTGNVGIGTVSPYSPLTFNDNLGEKISLYGTAGNNYGFGIQSGLLLIHTDVAAADIAFGYGSSNSFTERMRIINNVGYDGMVLNGRLVLKNGSADLVGGGGGVWLYKADNSALLGFMGAQNNQNVGFYGGPAGWGFVYDAINSRVGIGNSSPAVKLHVSNGSSGNASPLSPFAVESNTNTYINVLSPNANETGILFGKADNAASGGIVYNSSSLPSMPNGFQFRVNGNQSVAFLDNAGNMGIGANTTQSRLTIGQTPANNYALWLYRINGAGNGEHHWQMKIGPAGAYHLYFTSNNTDISYIDYVTGNYVTISDKSYKRNIQSLQSVLPKMMQLNPVSYRMKEQLTDEATFGFIAQELQQVFPDAVKKFEKDGRLGISYTHLIPLTIAAIQEQQKIIEKQQQQIDELKKLVEKLLKQ